MKKIQFAVLLLLVTATAPGCGDMESKELNNKTSQKKADAKNTAPGENPKKAKPVKVESSLPFKNLDVSTASKGIDPGRILIDAKGKDSAGKEMALSDYKGKVILLDTWASW